MVKFWRQRSEEPTNDLGDLEPPDIQGPSPSTDLSGPERTLGEGLTPAHADFLEETKPLPIVVQ